jgi:hypothetical protein
MAIRSKKQLSSNHNLPYCSICDSNSGAVWFNEEFVECHDCDFIFWSKGNLDVTSTASGYGENYWNTELASAHERAWGISVARAAEVVLLAKIPINKFLDIGTGSGDFLEAIHHFLPNEDISFIGVEKYPPQVEHRSKNKGYVQGWLDLFEEEEFDGGICIEVLEHLTVVQVQDLFELLSKKAKENSIFLFNTGLTDYVKEEDPKYLDPLVRGHISIWSVEAIARLVSKFGWQIYEMPNRKWAFLAEKSSVRDDDIFSRIWNPVPQNVNALKGVERSNLLHILGRDGLRAR